MTTTKNTMGQVILYEGKDKTPDVIVVLDQGTVWLSQKQMSDLFGKDVRTISEHIQNLYAEAELEQDSTIRKFRIVQAEGKRTIKRDVDFYNLDVIISVGYRVKSQEGTRFRIWATQKLKQHLLEGFTLNQKRLKEKGLGELEQALSLIEHAAETKKLSSAESRGLLDVITRYARTWMLLQKYDENTLSVPMKQKPVYTLTYEDACDAFGNLKRNLMKKKEASDLFGQEREEMLMGIVGNLYQTFDGKELYPAIEDKAAHLLYFIIKIIRFWMGISVSVRYSFSCSFQETIICFIPTMSENSMIML